jgi:hypothetical protein
MGCRRGGPRRSVGAPLRAAHSSAAVARSRVAINSAVAQCQLRSGASSHGEALGLMRHVHTADEGGGATIRRGTRPRQSASSRA